MGEAKRRKRAELGVEAKKAKTDCEIKRYRELGQKLFSVELMTEFAVLKDAETILPADDLPEGWRDLPYDLRCALSWDKSFLAVIRAVSSERIDFFEALKAFSIESIYRLPENEWDY